MASKKNKNEITAEELIGKLGENAEDKAFAEKIASLDREARQLSGKDDTDLDISELMRKYLPEYEEDGASEDGTKTDGETVSFADQLHFGEDDPASDENGDESDEKSAISFADSIFSEYEIGNDDVPAESEMNGSREETPTESGEIESERTRKFLSSLLHRGSKQEQTEKADEKAKQISINEPENEPEYDDSWTEDEDEPADVKAETASKNTDDNSDEAFLAAFGVGSKFVDRENLIDDDWTEDDDEDEKPAGTFGAKPVDPFADESLEDEPLEDDPLEDESLENEQADSETDDTVKQADAPETEETSENDMAFIEEDEEADEEYDKPFASLFGTEEDAAKADEESGSDDDENGLLDIFGDEEETAEAEEAPENEETEPESDKEEPDDEGYDDYDSDYDDGNEDTDGKDVDPTDLNLMLAFDIDSEDEDTKNKVNALGEKLEKKHSSRPKKKYILDRAEYVDKSQTAEIRKEFKKKRTSLRIRTLLCALCAIALFIFENITTLTRLFTGNAQQFAGAFDPQLYPVVYIMTSLQITLLACLCAIPEIIDGVKYLFKGAPKPSTMTALLAVASVIYAAVLSNLIKFPNEPVMFGFVVALSAFMTLVGERLNNKREMMNFRVIAGKKPKNVVRRLDDDESENESKAFPSSDRGCDVMKIEKTDFISNFFARLREPDSSIGTVMMFIMGVTVAVGVLFGVFSGMRSGNDGASVCRIIFAALFMLAPVSVQLAFSYPFYRANRAAAEYDSAIIGDISLDEYSNASIISFDDKNVFPSYSVKVQNIRIYNNARIDRVLYYAASVFAYAGGPLQDVFEIATKDMGISDNVHIFDTENGFLATQVDGVNIIFGSYDALTARGLEIPENAALDDVDFSDDLSIMYMFRENKLVAKMYIKYDMDEDIDVILKQFSGDGLYVCVRTYDPNIDEKMVAKKLGVKHVPLKVVRYVSTDEIGRQEEKVDSGLVTSSSPKSLLQVISYCEKVKRARKTNTALGVLSIIIGVALMLLIVLSGSADALSSFLIALYQLVWIIPMIIASKVYIR